MVQNDHAALGFTHACGSNRPRNQVKRGTSAVPTEFSLKVQRLLAKALEFLDYWQSIIGHSRSAGLPWVTIYLDLIFSAARLEQSINNPVRAAEKPHPCFLRNSV